MDLHILFVQYREDYPEQYAPEALVVWDEYCLEANPEGFEKACKAALAERGDDIVASRVFIISVDQPAIREGLLGMPKIAGKIVE